MLKLIKTKTSVLLPGGIIKKAGETFMCDLAFAEKLIQAKNAIEVEQNEGVSTVKSLDDMTINELKEFAVQNNIIIDERLTKKDDIYEAVKAGLDNAQEI
ncbi:hypothetical protein [Rummeliibacillus stabekisii]|uniref:Uncharacterized protein n=1 Tax=Rummeliibacillus stabekisii TaxID=241244 RepID=A0A143HCV3_9BACL|nr:hypothetical protein [Rummeliibacillus stabekisii]AMW99316.1 hypothetical protein ATY39_07455 [Rummeliibacillus stabekisii]